VAHHRGFPRLLPAEASERAARSHFQESHDFQSPSKVERHWSTAPVSKMTTSCGSVGFALRESRCRSGWTQTGSIFGQFWKRWVCRSVELRQDRSSLTSGPRRSRCAARSARSHRPARFRLQPRDRVNRPTRRRKAKVRSLASESSFRERCTRSLGTRFDSRRRLAASRQLCRARQQSR